MIGDEVIDQMIGLADRGAWRESELDVAFVLPGRGGGVSDVPPAQKLFEGWGLDVDRKSVV